VGSDWGKNPVRTVAPSTYVRRPRLSLNPDPKSTASLPQSWPQFKSPPHRRAPHQITAAPQRLAPAPIHRRAASAAARTRSRATDAPQLQDCPREISRRGGRGAIVPGVPSSPIPSSMEMTTSTIFAGASIWAPLRRQRRRSLQRCCLLRRRRPLRCCGLPSD
jgi:hypothetical protein